MRTRRAAASPAIWRSASSNVFATVETFCLLVEAGEGAYLCLHFGTPETALPLVVAGELLATGAVTTRGLLAPEALDPLPFLQALPSLGVRTRMIREEEGAGLV